MLAIRLAAKVHCGLPTTVAPTIRWMSAQAAPSNKQRNTNIGLYLASLIIGGVGLSYASVPLYKMFCQATGFGGTVQEATEEKFKKVKPVLDAKPITVHFVAQTGDTMPWTFVPQQRTMKVVPGEVALACYTAHNPTNRPITGVATYNVMPGKAGIYFNKLQCFCFDEQRLRPREEIDMPLLFYIDPEILNDPFMHNIRSITLSYTFFKTDEEPAVVAPADGAQQAAVAKPGEAEASAGEKIEAWKSDVEQKLGRKLPDAKPDK